MPTGSPTEPAFARSLPASLEGVRVDRGVAMVTGCSRSEAARLLAEGRVLLDGKVAKSGRAALHGGQRLEVVAWPEEPSRLDPDPTIAFDVVYADDDLVVVDKPAGLVVHPGAGHRHGTLVEGLVARFPSLGQLPEQGAGSPERPGIVHRLDRGTSGLMVVAASAPAYHRLVGALKAREVERRYRALVVGHPEALAGVVDAPVGRSAKDPTVMAVSGEGREARTRYRVLERLALAGQPVGALELSLETGRTHQIRVHLSAIGHPVVGDDRYRRRGRPPVEAGLAAGRLFLHAHRLALRHPGTGSEMTFESALPDDLQAVLGEAREA